MREFDVQFSKIALREAQSFEIPNEPGTMNFWHGGNLDQFDDTIAQKNGRYEYGPGLYLTTHFNTARKYAKGGRKMYLVTVAKGNELSSSSLPMDDVRDFVGEFVSTSKRKDALERLGSYERDGQIKASLFLNNLVNEKSVRPSNTPALRQFLIDHGIDYELVHSPFGWGEQMMVLYNMKKIVSYKRLYPEDRPTEYDLPVLKESAVDYADYLPAIASHISTALEDSGYEDEVDPIEVVLFGSRMKGTNRENSDLDALFIYRGPTRSKYLHDVLNNGELDGDYAIDIFACNEDDDEPTLKKIKADYDFSTLPKYKFRR